MTALVLGERVTELRRQRELATAMQRSELDVQVERGVLPVDRLLVL